MDTRCVGWDHRLFLWAKSGLTTKLVVQQGSKRVYAPLSMQRESRTFTRNSNHNSILSLAIRKRSNKREKINP